MFKYLGLLSLVLVVGCSSSAKKDTAAAPAKKTETPAAVAAPVAKEAPAATQKEAASKKAKKEAVAKSVAAEGEVVCSSGQDERKLAIKAKGEGCELEYTKAGQASSVASQISGNAKCEEVSTKIKEKLVAAGYKCE